MKERQTEKFAVYFNLFSPCKLGKLQLQYHVDCVCGTREAVPLSFVYPMWHKRPVLLYELCCYRLIILVKLCSILGSMTKILIDKINMKLY